MRPHTRSPAGEPGRRLRGEILRKAADLLEQRAADVGGDLTREEGKTLAEGIGETRRAVQILRYYPEGVLNLVLGKGSEVGDVLVTHGAVQAITFTGSNAVGRAMQRKAIEHGKKVQLELGGKNPAVVLDDADLDLAAEHVVRGAFLSAGQKCTATSRVIVQQTVLESFKSDWRVWRRAGNSAIRWIRTLVWGHSSPPINWRPSAATWTLLDGKARACWQGEAARTSWGRLLRQADGAVGPTAGESRGARGDIRAHRCAAAGGHLLRCRAPGERHSLWALRERLHD